MTLSRRILSEPVFSGQPVLSGHLEGSRGCPLNINLVLRVLCLFGQRVDASRDSGIMEKYNVFDWLSA